MKDLYMIACISRDGGLGKDGGLLWNIPEDMKFFRETTKGSMVIMGRRTFESIGRALPGRENVVLSRHRGENTDVTWCDEKGLAEILARHQGKKFIIGGASLYEKFLPEAEKIYLTEVDGTKPADTWFPEFDRRNYEKRVLQSGEYDGISYETVEYTKGAGNE